MQKTAVTIITGFLGAGKTSLLNHIIKSNPNKKFAIIENEFGEISIDSDLVEGVDKDGIYELSNGCICCSINDELMNVLRKLRKKSKDFDHLLIETTGIADPSAVIQSFIEDEKIEAQYRLDAVIGVADAANITKNLSDQEESRKQVAFSDVLVLNKTDLIDEVTKQTIISELKSINPGTKIIEASYCNIDTNLILNVNAFNETNLELNLREYDQHHHHHHHNDIKAMSFNLKGSLMEERFSFWLDAFLEFNSNNIYRIKGILSLDVFPQRMIIQSVRDSVVIEAGKPWYSDHERECKLIIIGKNLKKEDIESSLRGMLAPVGLNF